jgi:hypothetical protein
MRALIGIRLLRQFAGQVRDQREPTLPPEAGANPSDIEETDRSDNKSSEHAEDTAHKPKAKAQAAQDHNGV